MLPSLFRRLNLNLNTDWQLQPRVSSHTTHIPLVTLTDSRPSTNSLPSARTANLTPPSRSLPFVSTKHPRARATKQSSVQHCTVSPQQGLVAPSRLAVLFFGVRVTESQSRAVSPGLSAVAPCGPCPQDPATGATPYIVCETPAPNTAADRLSILGPFPASTANQRTKPCDRVAYRQLTSPNSEASRTGPRHSVLGASPSFVCSPEHSSPSAELPRCPSSRKPRWRVPRPPPPVRRGRGARLTTSTSTTTQEPITRPRSATGTTAPDRGPAHIHR